jgi:hypothetical protein
MLKHTKILYTVKIKNYGSYKNPILNAENLKGLTGTGNLVGFYLGKQT